MPIANCEKCGSLYLRTDNALCPACIEKEETEFQLAVDWLRENPGQNLDALSTATGIARGTVLGWIRERRLMYSGSGEATFCKRCGRQVNSGTLCDQCASLFSSDNPTKSATPTKTNGHENRHGGMHYVPRRRGRR
ncbi:MAG: hypothetical protein C4520_10565 [Candidatus Abyssobacteria bacterium SURF_5]|uniref:Flagellar protein n=1 Tax=Abyssobacteria bacterium (strain SURF_5) TaxID=2093360 RepID=A0A3A4NKC0_ABYX5|nr:MAG: hypothetical protein C4520_10565 [Candidatus Abyssubacteria bacterium SURF_5]